MIRRVVATLLGVALSASTAFSDDPKRDDGFPAHIDLVERATPNVLTRAEEEAGYQLLFDGESGSTWRTPEGDDFPESGWIISPEALTLERAGFFEFRAGGDLFSRERYGDFIFDFEFAIEQGANSGVKYAARVVRDWGFVHSLGCEYQILDDEGHADAQAGRAGNRRLASIYDLIPGNQTSFRGFSTWNHGRIHVEKNRIAHYLNGVRVLEISRASDRWKRALAESKFAERADFCAEGEGHLVLQDHGDRVRFRNLRVLRIPPPPRLDASANDS